MLSGMHASASRDRSLLRCASVPSPTIRNAGEDTLSLGILAQSEHLEHGTAAAGANARVVETSELADRPQGLVDVADQ